MAPSVPAQCSTSIPRVDHIGSLLRPKELVEKRIAFHSGQCGVEELSALEDTAVQKIVQMQKDLGLTILTDGEMRRTVYNEGIFEKLQGMTVIPDRPFTEYKAYMPYVPMFVEMGTPGFTSVKCTGKIRWTEPIYGNEFLALKQYVSAEDVPNLKVTMCGPSWMHLKHGSEFTYDHAVYSNDEEYFEDLTKAFRQEIDHLYNLGCRRVQFDDPNFAFFCSEEMISGMEKEGIDHGKLFDQYIDLYNAITVDRPADLVVSVHTCRGNMKGMHFSKGGYERIAQKLFTKLDVDAFYLEYDTERAGSLDPLAYLPAGKRVFLGLVTTKNGELENIETVKSRVREAAQIISHGGKERTYEEALNQISISPQCGFASVFEGNPISEEEEKQKLALLVEAARQIWG